MKNVYQLYADNGNQAGFYVKRSSWANYVFRVDSIGGISSGPLPGAPPYHGNLEVVGRYFDIRTKRDVSSQWNGRPFSCPGSYQWEIVGKP